MTCERCGADVITRYAGYTPVYRHAVPPKDAHYPKVPTPRSTPEASPPGSSLTAPSGGPQASPRSSETTAFPESA